ncbi:MAG: hypothetical protein NUW01_18480 [Gemmatimonadaceae bacterium]|nr:hypothetical protein [Gemmatimonadaceae bacterium]
MRYILAAAAFALALFGSFARAETPQPVCGTHADVLAWMKQAYSEVPVSIGLASNGAIVEVLRSREGTWTIVMTQPNGITCLMAAGEGWQDVAPKLPEKPA